MADVTVKLDPLSPGVVVGEDDFSSGGSAYDDVTALTPLHGPGYNYPSWSSDQIVIAGTTPRTLRPAAAGGDPIVLMGTSYTADYAVRVGFKLNFPGVTLMTYTASAIGRASASEATYYRLVYSCQRSLAPPAGASRDDSALIEDDPAADAAPLLDDDGRPLAGVGGVVTQRLKLNVVVAGVITTTASYTPSLSVTSGPHTIELRMEGSSITGWLNGTQVLSLTDSTITAAGSPGLGTASSISPSDGAGTPLTSFYGGALSPSLTLTSPDLSGSVGYSGTLAAPLGLTSIVPPSPAVTTVSPLASPAALPAAGVRYDRAFPIAPLAAPAGASASVGVGTTRTLAPLAGVATMTAGAAVVLDWLQGPTPLAAPAALPSVVFATGADSAITPLAAPVGLPDPAFATTVDVATRVNALALQPGLILSGVGTGRTVTLAPLAARASLPLVLLTAGFGSTTTLSPLAAPAAMASPSFAFDDAVVVGLAPLAAPAALIAASSGAVDLALSPLAAPADMLLAGATTTLAFALRPLPAPAALISAPIAGDARAALAPLPAPAALPLLSAYNPSTQQIVALTPLAAPVSLFAAQTSPQTHTTAVLTPLAAPASLAGEALASLIYVDQGAWARIGPGELDSNYPFVNPSLDLRHLIAEANFTYATIRYVPPIRVVWVGGLDRAFNLPPGLPTSPAFTPPGESPQADPTAVPDYTRVHPCDVVLWDAEDAVVFDSTQAADYRGSYYGPYFYVHRWRTPAGVLRITQRTAFPSEADAYQVPSSIKPVNGVLDERVTEVACRMVDSFTFDDLPPITDRGSIEGGWNVSVSTPGQATSGLSRVGVVDVGAAPGSGLGRYPGCEDPDPAVSEIGAEAPDAYGALRLAGDGCYNFHPEVTIVDGEAQVTPGKLVVGSECTACCSCDDFVGLAVQVIRLWNELQALAADAEHARDVFRSGVQRWDLLQPGGPPDFFVQTKALAHNLHYIDQVVQVCHMTDACLRDFEVEVDVVVQGDNHARTRIDLVADATTINTLCGSDEKALISRRSETTTPTAVFILDAPPFVGGSFIVRLKWDAVQPRTYGVARLRYSIAGLDYSIPTDVLINVNYSGPTQTVVVPLVE